MYNIVKKDQYTKNELDNIKNREHIMSMNVDSLFRDDYLNTTSSNYIFKLPTTIRDVMSMRLVAIELPNTWYTFTQGVNNIFTIKTYNPRVDMTDTTGGQINFSYKEESKQYNTFQVNISEGNYGTVDLETLMNNFFVNTPNNDGTPGDLRFLEFEVDDFSSKTRLRYKTILELEGDAVRDASGILYETVPFDFSYSVSFNHEKPVCSERPEYETCGWTLGFRKTNYESITSSSITTKWTDTYYGVLESEGIYGANKLNYLYLAIDDFVGNSKENIITGYNNRSYLIKNIIGRITIKYGSFYINLDAGDNIFRQRDYYGPVNIEKLQIKLFNKYGQILDLNGSDFSFILEFIQVR
tara:strand:- start:1047 stop:2111 length:1065 start_codon:yes stop_codon:yes gene_type:complete